LPGGRGGKFKLPTLTELHQYLFNQPFAEAHNATADVEATTRCFLELIRLEVFTKEELDVPEYFRIFKKNPREIQLIGLKHINLKQASDKIRAAIWKKEQERSSNYNFRRSKIRFCRTLNLRIYTIIHNSRFCNLLLQLMIW
jgi:DNA polymerase-3 subunit alpha